MFAKFSQYTKIPCCAHAQQRIFFQYKILFYSSQQSFNLVGLFPVYTEILSAHVAVSCQIAVDWTAQVESFDNLSWTQIKYFLYCFFQNLICNCTGTKGVYVDGNRLCNTDCVCQLYFTAFCQFCCNDILCNISCCISCRAVNLCRVFPENAPPP